VKTGQMTGGFQALQGVLEIRENLCTVGIRWYSALPKAGDILKFAGPGPPFLKTHFVLQDWSIFMGKVTKDYKFFRDHFYPEKNLNQLRQ
jgi:hypothetical protein